MSIFLIIELHIFCILVSCSSTGLSTDTTTLECVCALGYYQTVAATTTDPPQCQKCADGSTTSATDSQSQDACGKNGRIILSKDSH